MNLINWLLNYKMDASIYFEFSYGNTMQYDFLCIFETLDHMQHTKFIYLFFYLCFLLKKNWGLRGIFLKGGKITKKKKKQYKVLRGVFFTCFFYYYYYYYIYIYIPFLFFSLFFWRVRSTWTGWPDCGDPTESTKKQTEWKKTKQNKTDKKEWKTQKLKFFEHKRIKTKKTKTNRWMFFVFP
jgi:hypothetical protein